MSLRWVSLGTYGPAEHADAAANLAAEHEYHSVYGPAPISCGVFPMTPVGTPCAALPAVLVALGRTATGAPTVRVGAAGGLPVTARRLQGCPTASAALRRYGYTDRVLGPAGEAVPGEEYSPHWWPGPGQCVW